MKSLLVRGVLFGLLVWSGSLLPVIAQSKRASVRYVAASVIYGRLQIHSRKIEHFRGTTPWGVDIDWSWRYISGRAYSLCQCYPSLGISLSYRDFCHHALGEAYSALFYLEPELVHRGIANLYLRAGMGVSYLTNPFGKELNPLNLTYSTNFSFPLMIGLVGSRPLPKGWALNLYATFQHLSNGGTSQPNLGINYGAVGLGVQKKLDPILLPPSMPLEPFNPERGVRGFQTGIITGLKETVDGRTHNWVLGLWTEYLRQFGRINGWTLGAMAELDDSRSVSRRFDRSRYSLTAGHRFLLGRFHFGQTGGVYLWSGHQTNSSWYQYYSIDFRVAESFGLGVGLKAHGKVAEFLGTRISFVPF